MIPRIQGKVGQATEPPEYAGKWFFEVWLTTLGGGDEQSSLGQFGPWDTEEAAQRELRTAVQLVSEECERKMTGGVSGEYIDMKTNMRRRWDRQDLQ